MSRSQASILAISLAFLASCGAGLAPTRESMPAEPYNSHRPSADERWQVAEYLAEIEELDRQLYEWESEPEIAEPESAEPEIEEALDQETRDESRPRRARRRVEPVEALEEEAEPRPVTREETPSPTEVQAEIEPSPFPESLEEAEPTVVEPEPHETELEPHETEQPSPEATVPIDCGRDVCDIRNRICDLSTRICVIANHHPGDRELQVQCDDAWTRCERANRTVVQSCNCLDWEPHYPG